MNKRRRERIEKRKKDTNWSNEIRKRDGYICQVCLKQGNNAHHIIPRTVEETRWDVNNGITLCVGCHKFRKYSAHKHGFWFSQWLRDHRLAQFIYLDNIMKGGTK